MPTHRSPGQLTPKEIAVCRLLAQGWSNQEIGQELHFAPTSVKGVVSSAYAALGISDRVTMAIWMHQHRLVDLDAVVLPDPPDRLPARFTT